LKETRPLWPPQRGVGLREPNLGKTNPRVSLHYSLAICFAPSLADSIIFLTLTRLVVVIIFEIFSFALFTPPFRRLSNTASENVVFTGDCIKQTNSENVICTGGLLNISHQYKFSRLFLNFQTKLNLIFINTNSSVYSHIFFCLQL
jgi:hypothetical protein